jgi:hypothetical protein
MSWLLPSALGIAGIAAVVAVALHFIARSRPVAETLPTARFVPDRPVYARTRSIALTDLLLLLLRIAAIAIIGIAVAGPMFTPAGKVVRIVVADRSRAVGNIAEVRDSVRALLRAGDVLVAFDSTATYGVGAVTADWLRATNARGSLSAALAAAVRAGVVVAPRADSIELVLVSPLAAEEVDEATARLRAMWPGRIRLARVGASAGPPASTRIEVRAAANDAVQAGLALGRAPTGNVRVVRGTATAQDSAWAAEAGHVLVHWPASANDAAWPRRDSIDAIGGVAAGGATLVARFPRVWVLDGRAVARWSDGELAAVERAIGGGCIRDVGVLLDPASDLTLREPFRGFAAALLEPCGGVRSSQSADSSTLSRLAGAGPFARGASLRDHTAESSGWTPWLLVFGAALLILEMSVRRSGRGRAT